jgi:hypothetical protein
MAVLDVKLTGETNVPVVVMFVYIGVWYTATLHALWRGRKPPWECCPGEASKLGHQLSRPMAKICHVVCKWIASPSPTTPMAATSASALLTSAV